MESSPSTLFCRSVSFELELTVLDQIIIAPTNSQPSLLNNCREQREEEPSCPTIIEVEKEDQQSSQILLPKREEDEPELIITNHTNKKSSSSDYHFRDLLINQLKFYASWYLLEITSPPPLPLPLPSKEGNVGSEGEDADVGVPLSLPPPPLHQQNNGVIKIRGIAISKNKKPSRWTGLVSLLAAEHHHHHEHQQQNFLIGEGSFVKEINMKNLKSLFTKLLYSSSISSSRAAAAAVVRQKRSSSSSSSSNRRSVIDEIIRNSSTSTSSSSIEEGRRCELVESEDISSRPDFCVDDYFSSFSSSSSANPSTSQNKEKKLTVSIVDNLSLQDLIELKGAENLNAADICLFAKTKRLLEEEHQRVREEQYRLQQMRDKIFTGYKWPAHLDGINDKRYQKLYQWFKTYCDLPPLPPSKQGEEDFLLENNLLVTKGSTPLNRKKGLILFSKERRLGKSRFATSLVEDNPNWYIHCKGNFNKEAFINKPEAKLLIIDDFVYQESKHREIFKALISSEPTTIREAYMNYQFDHGLPTIICTNDGKFVKMASKSIYFKNDAYFTKIKEYMGPPNSRKSADEEDDTIVQGNPDFWTYLEEEEEEEDNNNDAANNSTTMKSQNKRKRGSGNIKNGDIDCWRGDDEHQQHQQNIRGKKSAAHIATQPLLLQQLLLMEKKQPPPPQLYLSSSGISPNMIYPTTTELMSGTEAVGSSKREFSPPLMSRLLNNQ